MCMQNLFCGFFYKRRSRSLYIKKYHSKEQAEEIIAREREEDSEGVFLIKLSPRNSSDEDN